MLEQYQIFMGLGAMIVTLGLALLAVGIIILIVKAVRKKPKKGAVILIFVSLLLAAAGAITFFRSMSTLSSTLKNSYDRMKVELAEKNSDGTYTFRLPEFSYTDDSGNTFDNSSFREYEYTVINWWEPWCVHCKAEMPDIERLYEDYRDKGINVIGIYSDEEDAEAVIAEYGLTYPTAKIDYMDNSPFSLIYTGGVPVTVIVDSEGCLVSLNLGEGNTMLGCGSPELEAAYDCLASGERTYDFWKDKLDALLG